MKGQSLVEVLVSLSIATVVLSAITLAVVYSLRNTQFSKNQNLASQYAAEGMEVVRQIRDSKSSLSGFLKENKSIEYCLPQDSQTLDAENIKNGQCPQNAGKLSIGPTPSPNYIYVREVKIEPPAPGTCASNYQVTVTVSWWDNVCGASSVFCHKVNLASCLRDRANAADKLL